MILSLFPGLGLLDQAFEDVGFSVVRGPDILWGGDVRKFHIEAGRIDGLIGGPPCQPFTSAAFTGSPASDLIPEFVRIWEEAGRPWVVMENVVPAIRKGRAIPTTWHARIIRDWDVDGLTHRRRVFFSWPFMLPTVPKRSGDPVYSVLATTASNGSPSTNRGRIEHVLPGNLSIEEYARLQGIPLSRLQPLRDIGASRSLLCHLIGNGVPLPMGRFIASCVKSWWDSPSRFVGE